VGDHASYYPGAKSLAIKLIYQKNDGLLLGAQVSGEQGVDKRIDVLATALYNKMKVTDLIELDLAYAPPYSSAKDPVIVAGMAASNAVEFQCDPYLPDSLKARLDLKVPYQLIDVRTSAERSRGYIEGSVHIPIDELRDRQNELAKDKEIILYCHKGLRGYVSARFLRNLGFTNVKNLSGGFTSWEMYGLTHQKS
jgi:rhodanese-related sulfurtransferase